MRRLVQRLGLSVLSAVLMVLSVPRFDLWPLMWVGLLPALFVCLRSTTPRHAFWQGWFMGIVANTIAFWWMRGLLERFGHMPPIAAVPIMLLLTTYQGLEFGLWAWGVFHLSRRCPHVRMAWLAPTVMVAIELLVPQIFPFYLAISQAWVLPVIQIADLTGPMGISFVLVMFTGAVYDGIAGAMETPAARVRSFVRAMAAPTVLVAVVLGYGFFRIHQIDARRQNAPHARIGIVQANVGIQEKWDPEESARLLTLHRQQSDQLVGQGADLLVWPESSYPYALPRDFAQDYPQGDPRRVGGPIPKPTLFGAVTLAADRRVGKDRFPYNSAFMLDGSDRITGRYDKNFLLIFGEYIPFYDAIPWFTRLIPEASNFSRGAEVTSFPFSVGGHAYKLGPLICYEDILSGYSRRVAALDPNLLVNITNDAWFGKTNEPYQHLALAVFRSVEHRLDMVRAVNTGVSAHIDATGRVRGLLDAADVDANPAPEAMTADAALLPRGGLYVYVGDLFAIACVAYLAWLLVRSRRGPASVRAA